ncbi:MAG: flavodoxin family protein [Oscillospiraceae bacterium]|nr:flavodoxin family protein [Oscillospiraceae bacterium]
MKVLLLNGSPHEKGCTYTALDQIADALRGDGVEAEILWLGKEAVTSCQACGACRKLGKCVYEDIVNQIADKMDECDGLIIGSPVHYAGASGQTTSVMDRLFYSASKRLRYKPGAAIVSARRGGTTAAFDQLNKYFTIAQMPVVSSRYWNMVHGNTPEQVLQDEEGVAIMRTLGHNMAWMLKCIQAGKDAGVGMPVTEAPVFTNFIR